MLRSIIDNQHLIGEVKKRPILYDTTKKSTPETRRACWEEIAKNIFKDVWDRAESHGKDALTKEIQVKWKSIRDTYNRYRKLCEKEDGKGKPRKKYIYHDLLQFLDKGGGPSNSADGGGSSDNSNTIYLQEEMSQEEDSTEYYFTENSNPLVEEDIKIVPQTVVPDTRPSKPLEKISEILSELVQLKKDENDDDKMGNKKFLMSLLPYLQKLPDDVNLEVRLQLMSVIHTYSSGENFVKM